MRKLTLYILSAIFGAMAFAPLTVVHAEAFPAYFDKFINNYGEGGGNYVYYGQDKCFYASVSSMGEIKKLCGQTVTKIAGYNQENYTSPDGSIAAESKVNAPGPLAVDNTGTLFFSERGSYLIRSITPDGILHTVAGNGSIDGPRTDTSDAKQTSFAYVSKISIGPDNLPYISDGNLVRRINSDGSITTVIGYAGIDSSSHPFIDGGQANSMVFPDSSSGGADDTDTITAFDPQGRLYVTGHSDKPGSAGAVYRLELDGTIHQILGGGQDATVSYTHDRAFTDSSFETTGGLTVGSDGTIWLSVVNVGIFVGKNNYLHLASGLGTQAIGSTSQAVSGMNTKIGYEYDLSINDVGYLNFVDGYRIAVLFTDYVTPTITPLIEDQPAPFASWYNTPVTIHWAISDPELSSGIPSPPTDTTVTNEGRNQIINSPQGCDGASNCTATTATVSIDSTPASVTTSSAPTLLPSQAFSGTATDSLSGVAYVRVQFENGSNPDIVYDSRDGSVALTCNADRTSCTWAISTPFPPANAYSVQMYVGDIANNNTGPVTQNVVIYL